MLIIGADDVVKPRVDLGTKIRELCEALLEDEAVIDARERIEGFLQNPEATRSYAMLSQLNDRLHEKESGGLEITEDETKQFETLRGQVMANSAVQTFAEARGTLQEIESMVMAYVSRTFELGRVPSEKEVIGDSGSCGSGCGCH